MSRPAHKQRSSASEWYSAHLQLQQLKLGILQLHLEDTGSVRHERHRRGRARGNLGFAVVAVYVDLVGDVAAHRQHDRGTYGHGDPAGVAAGLTTADLDADRADGR